jgi:hypothetical protein
MKTPVRPVAIVIASLALVIFTSSGIVSADTPEEPSGFAQAASAMNPLNWKMPQLKMPNFKSRTNQLTCASDLSCSFGKR